MAKDIIARLKADTSQWESGLSRAGRSMNDFKQKSQGMNSVMSAGVGMLTKFAAGYMGVQGAMSALNKTMESTQTLTDAYGRVMESVTSVTDDFFRSLATGDFGGFIDGLKDVIGNAREAYDAIDKLGTFMVYDGKVTSGFDRRRSKYRANIRRGVDVEASKQGLLDLEKEEKKYYQEQAKLQKSAGVAKLIEKTKSQEGKGWVTPYLDYWTGQDRAGKEADRLEAAGKSNLVNYYASGTADKVKALRNFAELSDKDLKEILRYYEDSNRTLQRIDDLSASDSKLLKAGTGGKSGGSSGGGSVRGLNLKEMKGMNYGNDFMKLVLPDFEAQVNNYIMGMDLEPLPIKVDWDAVNREFHNMKLGDIAETAGNIGEAFNQAANAVTAFGEDSKGAAQAAAVLSFAGTVATLCASMAEKMRTTVTIWDWIAGGLAGTAALGTMIGTMKRLQTSSYADGGVITGGAYAGDAVPIMANAGEVVLNAAMMSNLASNLQGGGGQQAQTYIKGEQLITVINNTRRRQGKGELL